ncbi:MAG TPA: acetylxylan esterase [Flavisolibacter sp.]|nr:acetylxylan esterase [Flavisolibacter sp.]
MKSVLTYRCINLTLIGCLFVFVPCAQKQFNVLDWKTDVSVNTWLVQKMQAQYEARKLEFASAVRSRQSVTAYIDKVRATAINLFGAFPVKSPLNAVVAGTLQKEGYRIEKIYFESFPGHHVTVNLYVPQGKGPFPAALFFCGHEDLSKATESYQRTAILFAKKGFVVLVIDPISQGERYQLADLNGKALTRGGTTEHTLLNEASNLLGTSTPSDELWDNVRALDYLFTRKEVDTTRIGCLGNSGGGMQTVYFAAYERRIKVIAVCSFLMNRERALELTGPSDGCSHMPGEGKLQMEMNDFLLAAAPRPLLILAGRYDFIDYTGTVAATRELKQAYSALGQPDKVHLVTVDDGHGISKHKREAAVAWFQRWLKNEYSGITEGDLASAQPAELNVTATGQVSTAFQAEVSLPQRNLVLYDRAAQQRQRFMEKSRVQQLLIVRNLLGIETSPPVVDAENVGIVEKDGLRYRKVILRKRGEVPLPILVLYPRGEANKVIIWCSGNGKNKLADSSAQMQTMLTKNAAIVLADLRGIGETEDKPELNDPKYFNREYRNAMLAVHIGRPIVGQRITDIQTVLDFISSDKKLSGRPVQLNASGLATHPALYAALLDRRIERVELSGLLSYKDILEHPVERDWYSYVIPDVLHSFDIPDIVKLVGEEKIVIGTVKF